MIAGKPLVQRVYEQARGARLLDEVVVATDDTRIYETVEAFGGTAVMTPADCPSGTDRAAHVARDFACEWVVNIQGDEPLLEPAMIDQLVAGMQAAPDCPMGTLARPITNAETWENPNVVKVVFGVRGNALYFSRRSLPYAREAAGRFVPGSAYKHLGIYAYRREFLLRFVTWAPTPLEQMEKLEQLRALEHDVPIRVWVTDRDSIGVDTPADVKLVEEILAARGTS